MSNETVDAYTQHVVERAEELARSGGPEIGLIYLLRELYGAVDVSWTEPESEVKQ